MWLRSPLIGFHTFDLLVQCHTWNHYLKWYIQHVGSHFVWRFSLKVTIWIKVSQGHAGAGLVFNMSLAVVWEPDRRWTYFRSPAHLCAVTNITEILLNVTFSYMHQFNLLSYTIVTSKDSFFMYPLVMQWFLNFYRFTKDLTKIRKFSTSQYLYFNLHKSKF